MRRFFAYWLVILLAGCAGLSGLSQKPEISLAGLELAEFKLFEQRFKMKLRIQNPNDADLRINGLTFDVDLGGQPFAKGLSERAVTVPRLGEAILDVQATSNLGSVLKQLRELKKRGRDRVDYRLSGRVDVDGYGSIPFDRRGDVQMPALDLPHKRPDHERI